MRKIINIYSRPAYIIHELSHAMMGLIFFNKVDTITVKVNRQTGLLYGWVIFEKEQRNIIEEILVSLSPLILMLINLSLAFKYDIFIYVIGYQISTLIYSLPSSGDIKNIKNFRLYKKFNYDLNLINEYKISKGEKSIFSDTTDIELKLAEQEILELEKRRE